MKDDDQLAAIITCAMNMIPNGGTANVVIQEVKKLLMQHMIYILLSLVMTACINAKSKLG